MRWYGQCEKNLRIMKIENVGKKVFFKKHPYFWAKNGERCIFGLKTRAQKRKYEPKIVQKMQIRAQISMIWGKTTNK
jgi:cytochrome b subunit of formate dehydrogenase